MLKFMPRSEVAPTCPKCKFAMTIGRYAYEQDRCECTPNIYEEHLEVRCVQCGYTLPMRPADAKVDS